MATDEESSGISDKAAGLVARLRSVAKECDVLSMVCAFEYLVDESGERATCSFGNGSLLVQNELASGMNLEIAKQLSRAVPEELESLRAENDRLREQLRLLRQGEAEVSP